MSTPVQREPRSPSRARRLYGASAWHLVALLGCFLLSAYAISRLFGNPALLRIAVWFAGAAVVWDLVLGPAFAAADRLLRGATGRVRPAGVPLLPYLRVPAAISALLLLVWTPLIFQRSEQVYQAKAGLTQDPYLERWVAVTVALFLASAAVWGLAVARSRRRRA